MALKNTPVYKISSIATKGSERLEGGQVVEQNLNNCLVRGDFPRSASPQTVLRTPL
jgi:hypothetical protein